MKLRIKARIITTRGYALPAVITLATALLMIGLSIAQGSLATRQSLLNQYYTRLAKEAGQAGAVHAQDCLAGNANVAQWTVANPLKPNTDCTGTPLCGNPTPACTAQQLYISSGGGFQSTYSVAPPDSSNQMKISGMLNAVHSDGSVYRTYTQVQNEAVPTVTNVKVISYGVDTYVLKSDGSVWAWGDNDGVSGSFPVGLVGNNSSVNQLVPTRIIASGVTNIYVNSSFTLYAQKSDGSLWAWGENSLGQVGDGTTVDKAQPVQVISSGVSSVIVNGINGNTAYVIKTDGSVWAWGDNSQGGVGNGTTTNQLTPVRVVTSGASQLIAGYKNAFLIKTDGSLWDWGNGLSYQMGSGTNTNRLTPASVIASAVAKVTVSANDVYVIKTNGSLWTWGYNSYGAVGNGTTTNQATPVQILASGASQVTAADAGAIGNSIAFLIKTDGSLWAWGYNFNSQLGDGTTVNKLAPVRIITSGALKFAAQPANQSYFLKTDNSLWTWGISGPTTPTQFSTNVSSIQLGGFPYPFGLIQKTDGSVWAWGTNNYGNLGNGSTSASNQTTPTQVSGLGSGSGITQIDAGYGASVALKSDGTVYTWGGNTYGEIGDGTTVNKLTPVIVIDSPGQTPVF